MMSPIKKRQGKGGGLEYAFDGLPKKVQAEIKARQTAELMKASKSKAVSLSMAGQLALG